MRSLELGVSGEECVVRSEESGVRNVEWRVSSEGVRSLESEV